MGSESKKTWSAGLLILALLMSQVVMAAGGRSDGGGDPCESRIKIIRDDLRSWILSGGPEGLILPASISIQHYSDRMLEWMDSTQVGCVSAGDPGYPA